MKLALKCRLIAEHTGGIYADSLQAFADLVRADERKACAVVAEKYEYSGGWLAAAKNIAAAIQARGNK